MGVVGVEVEWSRHTGGDRIGGWQRVSPRYFGFVVKVGMELRDGCRVVGF